MPVYRDRRGGRWVEDCTKIVDRCKRCICEAGKEACIEVGACGPGGTGREHFRGFGAVDPNIVVTTIGETISNIAGRYRYPATQYIAPPTACSMFERADASGMCRPNYSLLFVVVAGVVAFASVSLGPRRR